VRNLKKKYKIYWNRVLVVLLIPIVLIYLIYFGLIKDTAKEKLSKIGYSKEEITEIRKEFSSTEIKKLYDYSYLSFLTELVSGENYHSEKLLTYINYILEIDDSYDVDSVIYLINNGIDYPYSTKLVELSKSKYFIKDRLDRYMAYDSSDIDTIITSVNSNIDYEFYTNMQPTDPTKDTLMLVNKYYYLGKDDYCGELVTMEKAYDNKSGSKLNSVAYEAFKKLVDAAEKEGYHIRNNSAYRSYETQASLYNSYKNSNGLSWADKWSARPGNSEHQTGLSLDVGVKSEYSLGQFESSKEFTWMKENAHLYGFILRYPKGKEAITGYDYEPWHYRYVGVEAATYIYENDITFDEYYAYFVENN
jgi:D-alanyl-D-alanine carboxypeptidase